MIEGGSQIFGTVAGPTRLYVLLSSIYVSIVEDDAEMEPLSLNAIISETERETLINDYLACLLGTAVGDFRKGLWWLHLDGNSKIRRSYEPQYW